VILHLGDGDLITANLLRNQ